MPIEHSDGSQYLSQREAKIITSNRYMEELKILRENNHIELADEILRDSNI